MLYLTHFYQTWTGNIDALREIELDAVIKLMQKVQPLKRVLTTIKPELKQKKQHLSN